MSLPCRISLLLAVAISLSACGRSGLAQDRVDLVVASDGEFLAFTPQELSCRTGQRVRLTFRHTGQRVPQKHNWALLLPGTVAAVEKAGTTAGEAANWLPPRDHRVLAATPLCSPGGEAVVEFTAPAPGNYPYICSTPGHAMEMQGVLHVTALSP